MTLTTATNEPNDNDYDWDYDHQSNKTANNWTKVCITDKSIEQKWVTLAVLKSIKKIHSCYWPLTCEPLTCIWSRGCLYASASWSGWSPWCCGHCPITNWRCCIITETSNSCCSIQIGKRRILDMNNLAHWHESFNKRFSNMQL